MANSRIARFIMEVAPPQYITVMRHRTSKMLDTISEEDQREITGPTHTSSSSSSCSSSPRSLSSVSSSLPSSSSSTSALASASSASIPSADTKYFLKEVHRSLSALNH